MRKEFVVYSRRRSSGFTHVSARETATYRKSCTSSSCLVDVAPVDSGESASFHCLPMRLALRQAAAPGAALRHAKANEDGGGKTVQFEHPGTDCSGVLTEQLQRFAAVTDGGLVDSNWSSARGGRSILARSASSTGIVFSGACIAFSARKFSQLPGEQKTNMLS